jgi:hypothetical protein
LEKLIFPTFFKIILIKLIIKKKMKQVLTIFVLLILTIFVIIACDNNSITKLPIKNSEINEEISDLKEWIKVDGDNYIISYEDNYRIRITINFLKLKNTENYSVKSEDFYIVAKDKNDNVINGVIIDAFNNAYSLISVFTKPNTVIKQEFIYNALNKENKKIFKENIDHFDIYCEIRKDKSYSEESEEDLEKLKDLSDKLHKSNSDALDAMEKIKNLQ